MTTLIIQLSGIIFVFIIFGSLRWFFLFPNFLHSIGCNTKASLQNSKGGEVVGKIVQKRSGGEKNCSLYKITLAVGIAYKSHVS